MMNHQEVWQWLQEHYYPAVEAGDLEGALAKLREVIDRDGTEIDRRIAGLRFTNSAAEIQDFLRDGYRETKDKDPEVGGIYIELNGFSTNPDRWFVSLDGIENVAADELPDWEYGTVESNSFVYLTMTGAEDAQAVYASVPTGDPVVPPLDLTDYVVHATFMRHIKDAWNAGPGEGLDFPVLVTAHDMEPLTYLAPRGV